MSYTVTNMAKRPIVCTLGDKSTLRLPIKGHTVIKDTQMTDHLKNLRDKGLVVLSEVENKPAKRKNTTKK